MDALYFTAAALAASCLLASRLRSGYRPPIPPKRTSDGDATVAVSQLWCYPVKSMRGQRVHSLQLDAFGATSDRRFMVCRTDGSFITQRQAPVLATITPQLVFANGSAAQPTSLLLTRDGGRQPPITLRVLTSDDDAAALRTVRIWGQQVQRAVDQGDAVAAWLCAALEEPDVRLVYMDAACARELRDSKYAPLDDPALADSAGIVSFTDGFPLLILGEASVADLNTRTSSVIAVNRFRPNIVVRGAPAFAEDGWRLLHVNGIPLRGVKRCSRCRITTIDQERGEGPDDPLNSEPLKSLQVYRTDAGGRDVYMGVVSGVEDS